MRRGFFCAQTLAHAKPVAYLCAPKRPLLVT
jgi:hypothetical protein